ncbi:unnamed protein product [Prorocentrum cordatum]|uniref:EF-hand domain-containing protein n=1 Tax=Prorocentrum cordatum TaxID=2364126 RepID=A0ABN9WAI6_9DINO|nr:unnamed protein product [Polarella glacialis]
MGPPAWPLLCAALLLEQATQARGGGQEAARSGAPGRHGGRAGSCDEDDVGLLQAPRLPEPSRPGSSQGSARPEFLALERLSDANLAGLTGAKGAGLRLDSARWAEIFRELDKDGDNVIEDSDMLAGNFTLLHHNVSFTDY